MYKEIKEEIIRCEKMMWSAFTTSNEDDFRKLVLKEALMVCGGNLESGDEYAKYVKYIKDIECKLSDFKVLVQSEDIVLVNYVANVICEDPNLNGRYRVSSLWKKLNKEWKLVFNQDSKLV